jgi:hypothetical protein
MKMSVGLIFSHVLRAFIGLYVGPSVGQSVIRSVGQSVSRLIGHMFAFQSVFDCFDCDSTPHVTSVVYTALFLYKNISVDFN